MNISEINNEINRLEKDANCYADCEKLSVLYNVRNNFSRLITQNNTQLNSYDEDNLSEFMRYALAADRDRLLDIIDEHMELIRVLHPREYYTIIDKIKNQ